MNFTRTDHKFIRNLHEKHLSVSLEAGSKALGTDNISPENVILKKIEKYRIRSCVIN